MMLTGPIVMKFGGTSVADAEAIARVVGIVKGARESSGLPPVVIVSAMSGVTDRLLELTEAAGRRRDAHVLNGVADLSRRHFEAVERLLPPEFATDVLAEIGSQLDDLRALLKATGILRAASPSAHDAIVRTGELMNSRILAAALAHAGVATAWVDARRAVVTDGAHSAAGPLAAETREAVAREIVPRVAEGRVPVLGGFVGATVQGVTTTLGRGGSDYSAADRRRGTRRPRDPDLDRRRRHADRGSAGVANPRVVPHLSFGEASELAYFGAKVLHPSTILPAVAKDIPVRILNSRRAEATGTTHYRRAAAGRPSARRGRVQAARDHGRDHVDAHVDGARLPAPRVRDLRTLSHRRRRRDHIRSQRLGHGGRRPRTQRHRGCARVSSPRSASKRDLAILCAVGDNLRSDPRIAARVIGALEGFRVRMVSQAASRRNVTIVLSDKDLAAAMAQLHDEFFQEVGVRTS